MTKKITKLMLNGEEYEIREYQAWWQPWADTYCYLPLVSDYVDYSWNSVAVTSDITSYDTSMFPWWTGKYICVPQNNIIVAWADWTILFWIYPRNKNDSNVTVVAETANWNSLNFSRQVNAEFGVGAAAFPSGMWYTDNAWWAYDAWHLFWLSHEANWYIKWAWDWQAFTWTRIWDNVNFPLYFWRHVIQTSRSYWLLWQLKDIIIETKARTDQEFSDYFNQTKWDYWIS